MTSEQKRLIDQYRRQGMGSTEIAEKLNLSVNTVKSYCRRNSMETDFDFDYTDVYMSDSEILLYDASALYVFRTSGRQKLGVAYERPVKRFENISGLRNYLVITNGSIDRIRVN